MITSVANRVKALVSYGGWGRDLHLLTCPWAAKNVDLNSVKIENLPRTVSSEYWGKRRIWDRWFVEANEGNNIPVHVGQRDKTVDFIKTLPEGLNVLDLCCGTGKVSFSILDLPNVSRLTSVDISAQALEIARQHLQEHPNFQKVQIIHGNLYDSLETLSPMDCIVCLDALHHLPDIKSALVMIHQKLEDEGIFIGNFLSAQMAAKHVIEKRGFLQFCWEFSRAKSLKLMRYFKPIWGEIGRRGYVRMVLLNEQTVKDLLESLFTIKRFEKDDYFWFVAQKK